MSLEGWLSLSDSFVGIVGIGGGSGDGGEPEGLARGDGDGEESGDGSDAGLGESVLEFAPGEELSEAG